MWLVEYTDEFAAWWVSLDNDTQAASVPPSRCSRSVARDVVDPWWIRSPRHGTPT